MINRPYREYVKQKEARAAEMAERNRDFAQYARRVIEKVSDSEIEAYQRLQAAK